MEPVGMRSVAIAMMVAALMILRTAAYPGYPGPTPESKLDTSTEAETTSELPTTSEPTTTSELPTTSEPLTTTTSPCPVATCGPNCEYATDLDGCSICDCHPTCMDVTCDPNERCIMIDVQCGQPRCFPVPTCMRYDGPPTRPPTSTSTETPTSPSAETPTSPPIWTPPADCPDLSSSCTGECVYHVDYSSGQCPTCDCPYPFCTGDTCSPEEQCVENSECPEGVCHYCIPIVIIDPTSIPTPMTPGCPEIDCPGYPFCQLEDSPWDECPVCVCTDPACMMQGCPPGQECLPTDECPACYTCQGTIVTTTTTAPTTCPPYPLYARLPGCAAFTDSNGCITAHCFTCDDISCDEGTTCELQICSTFPCPPPVICVASTGPPTSTLPTPPPPPCPDWSWCTGSCSLDYSSEGCPSCICTDSFCQVVTCVSSEECNQNYECYYGKCYSCIHTVPPTPTPPTPPPPCPDVSWCAGSCRLDYSSEECPSCTCPHEFCQVVTCVSSEECNKNYECYYGRCYSCTDTGGSPTETPTWTPTETLPTTTLPCPDVLWCTDPCSLDYSSERCPNCICPQTFCQVVTCDSSEECNQNYECYFGNCYSCTFTGLPTEPTTPPPCPDVSWCTGDCQLQYSSEGCPNCSCFYMFCQAVTCFSSQECHFNSECYGGRCYSCYYIDHTRSPSAAPTTVPCSSTSCDSSPLCSIDYSSGDCACVCVDPACMLEGCPPGQACLPNGECDTCYSCLPDGTTTTTTTELTTETTTWSTTWSIINCATSTCGLYCSFGKIGANGCPVCDCNPEDACLLQHEDCPAGEECVPTKTYCNKDTCFYEPRCFPVSTTPPATTTGWCSQTPCPSRCRWITGIDGCPACDCTTDTPTPCPIVTCAPDCVSDTGSDGCTTCECPPSCKTVKCSAGHECQLVNVTCIRYPCFPQPQCVPVEDPCTGTPNPGRCGRGSKTRWTYNSQNDTCESFRYYGCTPSPNTFRSRKECKDECTGNSQIVCATVVCDDDCYTLERQDECPLCICPNPCKEFQCRKGYECKMRESKCSKGAKPFCAKIADPCPPQDPCGIRCMYGLKTDKNGCQLCECLEAPRFDP